MSSTLRLRPSRACAGSGRVAASERVAHPHIDFLLFRVSTGRTVHLPPMVRSRGFSNAAACRGTGAPAETDLRSDSVPRKGRDARRGEVLDLPTMGRRTRDWQ